MRTLALAFALATALSFPADAQQAGNCDKVRIDDIVSNQSIAGRAMPDAALSSRVVVYVHTDKWYVHPYTGQGDGLGWAHINPDGTWSIKTVKREFLADSVGAFVIAKTARIPNVMSDWRSELQAESSCLVNLSDHSGTKWYGRL